ncbi:MAG: zf-HC2 domain-containing protein [Anaerolineae bacterium]|jgi:hypothetical protein|nr:zf-HC2 domain-containing protein [Anaerolineae bacterium]
MHVREGTLRAYLDKQVTPEEKRQVEEHLRTCAACRERLARLEANRNLAAAAMSELQPTQATRLPHPSVALARFRQRYSVHEHQEGRKASMTRQGALRRWRPVWIGLVVFVIASLFVFYPPLRTAASDFLGVFRVRKFVAVPINVAALENPTFGNLLQSGFSDQFTVTKEPGPAIPVASLADASAALGFAVRLPSALPQGYPAQPNMSIQDEFGFRARVSMDYVLAVREALGKTDVPIPPGLDGAVLDVTVPKILAANYASERGWLTVIQAMSPEVQLPPNLDLRQIGEFGLRLAGIPAAQARAMAAAIDWANTLIIPVPLGYASYQEVTVAGAHGVFLEDSAKEGARHGLLVFEKDGIVYGLEGPMSAQEMVAVAESMF